MISHFFIDRPIFATVLSIVITLTGAIALLYLPIAQYPQITPPAVSISILYPGASAQVVSDTVAAPIEQQVNGVEGMLYMASQMGNDGSYTLTVTFEVGTNLNTALVMVQNRVTLALPLLPTEVQRQGITVRKRTPDILMIVSLYSPDGRYDDLYLSNFATLHIRDELLRVEGVSDIIIFGQRDYAIRAWLDPQKIASYGINAGEVAAAVLGQNADVPAGQVGQPPALPGQPFQLPIDTLGRLSDPEQFGNIILKSGAAAATPGSVIATPAAPTNVNATVPLPGRLTPQPSAGLSRATSSMAANTAVSGLGAPVIDVFGSGSTTLSALISGSQYQPSGTGSNVPGGMSSLSNFTAVGTVPARTGNPAVAVVSSGNVGGGTAGGGGTTGGGATIGGGATTGGPLSTALTSAVANQSTATNANGLSVATLSVNGQTTGLGTTTTGGQQPPEPSVGIVRLRDVARVELGAQNYNQAQTFDGHQSVGIAVFQLPNTNALDVAGRVTDKLEELKSRFPDGVNYQVPYDTTPFIRESVADVIKTLFEAVILVALVVLVFLQNWRTTLIPLAAVPVAIFGTFAAMAIVGFSLNNISLFGLVLAIGIVVDDAIVVVENVERWMAHGLEPREATMRAMTEVTGPVIAVALVLCAVFVPCAFISGITGRFFRQFAVTIAVSTAFSAINSLTLSPALAALLLKKKENVAESSRMPPRGGWLRWAVQLPAVALQWLFSRFDAVFGAGINGYAWIVGKLLRLSLVAVVLYGVLIVLTYEVFHHASTGFVPEQDQGRILASIQLPDAASLERTRAALAKIDQIARSTEGVEHALTVAGFSFVQQANGPNFASMFMSLKPFDERRSPRLRDTAIMARLRRACSEQVKDAQFLVFGAPPIPGLSVAGGFKLIVEDRGGLGLPTLGQQTDALIRRLQKEPRLVGVSTQFRSNTPQLFMDIDRSKVASVGIALSDVNQTLGIYLGSLYVNSFNLFGRHWQVELQAQGDYRNDISNIRLLEVRNAGGQMVPLSTMVAVRDIGGPIFVNRYNLYTAASITGSIRSGVSSGDVIAAVDAMAGETLPLAMKTDWTELMYMQIHEGNTTIYVFGLAVVCVFLALAALYESWSLPLAVILVVPLCLLCSIAGVLYTNRAVDIFVQIGLVVLVGLACKNAILVVEFAKYMHEDGRPRFEATVEASRLRLRPILMTSFAFILGVVPLVIATGAGSEMRQSLGTAVFSGMVGVTLFGIFLTPVAFYVIQGISGTRLFSSAAMHWIGSAALGAVIGAGAGYSFTQLGLGSMPWMAVYGGSVGVLLFLTLVWIHRRIRHQP